jgi:hypothetical protein
MAPAGAVDLQLDLDPHDVLIVRLREGAEETSVSVHPASAGAASLIRAVDDALASGYGECFWPGLTGGQYWWIVKRDADTIDLIAMWTRGGAAGWEHVFRATDSASWLRDRIAADVRRLGLSAA